MTTAEDPTVKRIMAKLRATGQATYHYTDDKERDELRSAGRQAGRALGRPVRTIARNNRIHIVLTDWGDNPLERQLDDAKTRNAIDRALGNRR